MSLRALLLVLVAALGVVRAVVGTGSGLLPLLAAAPALAAVIGGTWYVLAVGAEALAVAAIFLSTLEFGSPTHQSALTTIAAATAVTAAGVLLSRFRSRRERELAQVRLVAEAAQQVVLRPVPHEAGPVRLSAMYLSASEGARVGGDLYGVVTAPDRVRLVIGDAEGKGLPALRSAAAVLGVFRDAAYEEESLARVAARIETSLSRQLGPEEFVTAMLAEITADGSRMELLGCGHPAPLLLGSGRPRLIAAAQGGLPLGLGSLGGEPRRPVTVSLAAGDQVLFYTDGLAEARNSAGDFFPLLGSACLCAPQPPDTLVERLSKEMIGFTGRAPDDDVALLLLYRDQA